MYVTVPYPGHRKLQRIDPGTQSSFHRLGSVTRICDNLLARAQAAVPSPCIPVGGAGWALQGAVWGIPPPGHDAVSSYPLTLQPLVISVSKLSYQRTWVTPPPISSCPQKSMQVSSDMCILSLMGTTVGEASSDFKGW